MSLHFSFCFAIHSVPCNDQCKIFQIINGPLLGRNIFTIPENHDLPVLRSRSHLTEISSPFYRNGLAITPWLLSFPYRGNFGFLKYQLKSPTTLSLNCFIAPVNCLVWVSARVKAPCYRVVNLQSTLKTSTLQVQSHAFFFFFFWTLSGRKKIEKCIRCFLNQSL